MSRPTIIERHEQRDQALRDYGVDPKQATAAQREMADCIAQKTNEAHEEIKRR